MNPGTVESINLLLNFGLPLGLIVLAYLIGSFLERRHFVSIRKREDALHDYPVTNFQSLPGDWRVGRSGLVTGSVVISLDYFKRIIAGLRGLIGGRVKTYEPLLDRARREALLRMAEEARAAGYDAVVNVRLKTSRLANSRGNGQGTAGVEMLAFGTGITLDRR
ncbi:MAG: heavy metal-binding domain-containing protein [Woeseiaceae bacterium]|nr:heavy metal-binding domain-containing protein [Woeseiaceae bacterium]